MSPAVLVTLVNGVEEVGECHRIEGWVMGMSSERERPYHKPLEALYRYTSLVPTKRT
jgi:hypothetical protein